MKNLNRKKVVAAATTGAMLAGIAGFAYFGSTSTDNSAVTGGEISFNVALTNLNDQDMFPVTESRDDGDNVFTASDFEDAERAADVGDLNISADEPVELSVFLTSLTVTETGPVGHDGFQYRDMYVGVCDGATQDFVAADCYFESIATLVDDFTNAAPITEVVGADDYVGTVFLWLASNGPQTQDVQSSFEFAFEARTTGRINPDTDTDNDGTPDAQDDFPNDPTRTTDADGDGLDDLNGEDDHPGDYDNDGVPTAQDADDNDPNVGAPTNDGIVGVPLLSLGDGHFTTFEFLHAETPGNFVLGDGSDVRMTVYALDGNGSFGLARSQKVTPSIIMQREPGDGSESGYVEYQFNTVFTNTLGEVEIDVDATRLEGAHGVSFRLLLAAGNRWSYYSAAAEAAFNTHGDETYGASLTLADILDGDLTPFGTYSVTDSIVRAALVNLADQDPSDMVGAAVVAAFDEMASAGANSGYQLGKTWMTYGTPS